MRTGRDLEYFVDECFAAVGLRGRLWSSAPNSCGLGTGLGYVTAVYPSAAPEHRRVAVPL